MTTLRLELEVRDYDMWREAFAQDRADRAGSGMRSYRIFRPVDDEHRVMLDSEFDDAASAQTFLDVMRTQVWPDPAQAPAKIGQPRTAVVELVESHQY
jgi:quinol monooxygenase YgiN